MFIAPYVTACWPHPVDCYEFYAILYDSVVAYEEGDENSAREAYVERKKTRSAIDYRAYFVKRDGAWGLRHFIAGD